MKDWNIYQNHSNKLVDDTIDNSTWRRSTVLWVRWFFNSEKTHVFILNFRILPNIIRNVTEIIVIFIIHWHTPVKPLARSDHNAVRKILEDVFKWVIIYFFDDRIYLFSVLHWFHNWCIILILYIKFVDERKLLRAISWVPLEKTHSKNSDVSIRDKGQPIPTILTHVPVWVSLRGLSFEITHFLIIRYIWD